MVQHSTVLAFAENEANVVKNTKSNIGGNCGRKFWIC